MKNKKKESYKVRGFRMDEKTYQYLVKCKERDKSWNLFFGEMIEIIQYFKKL